jgi:release factor glutamine methyltransferase
MGEVYSPGEDSHLLVEAIEEHFNGLQAYKLKAIDIGTGSGILALKILEMMKKKGIKGCVFAADINKTALKQLKDKRIKPVICNLFSGMGGRFDLIVFNPPYLPIDEYTEKYLKEVKHNLVNYGVIERFIRQLPEHLAEGGSCLLLISTLTGKGKIEKLLRKRRLGFEIVKEKKMDFERLIVYRISIGRGR